MRKLLIIAGMIFLCSHHSISQVKGEEVTETNTNPTVDPSKLVVKVRKPEKDRTDTIGLTGVGNVSFIVSNTADGTANTFRHSQRIVLPLLSPDKNNKYQLVFYGEYDNINYAVSADNGLISIYYPAYMFAEMKQRLEQSLTQKKKVELRITQKRDGFREGIIVF